MKTDPTNQLSHEFFGQDTTQIINFIFKHLDRFKHEWHFKKQNGLVRIKTDENKDAYRFYVRTEFVRKTNMEFVSTEPYQHDSFVRFSDLLRDLIYAVNKELVVKDGYKDESLTPFFESNKQLFLDDISDVTFDNLVEGEYFRPNTLASKIVIKYVILYAITKHSGMLTNNGVSIGLDDVIDFVFSYGYDKDDDTLQLSIKTESTNGENYDIEWRFIHEDVAHTNVLSLNKWKAYTKKEKEEEDKLSSFNLTVDTIVSEINKFKTSYENITLIGAGDTKYTESMLGDIFKVYVKDLEDLKINMSELNCNGNTIEEKFDEFEFNLEQIIHYTFTDLQKRGSRFYFIGDNGSKSDNVEYNDIVKYYKPNLSESRMVLTWVVIYKLCKKYNLDRTKIKALSVLYHHKFDLLSILMKIDGVDYEFRLPHAKDKSILNLFSWHDCYNCDIEHCVFLEPDEKIKDESVDLIPFSDF